VSPSTRGELGLLATELAGATRRDPTACAAVIDAIITAAARYVAVPEAARQIRDRALERSMTHTASRLRRSWWSATRCDFTRAAERSLCGVVVQVARTADDAALLDLLRSGLAGYRAPARPAVGYSPVAPSASSRATSS
jgi:hypothetical protein